MQTRILTSGFTVLAICLAPQLANAQGTPLAGDIVARDLDIVFVGKLGHVGISAGSDVLEVLNDSKKGIVQWNTFKSFRDKTTFWGARGGIGAAKIFQILDSGWKQRLYSPVYNYSRTWTEGGLVKQGGCIQYNRYGQCVRRETVVTTAAFRCDTFVNFAFLRGNGAYLDPKTDSIMPSTIYNAMPNKRL